MSESSIELKASDLNENGSIACPSKKADMHLWNMHPLVYLNVASVGHATCPYCGTRYALKEGEVVTHSH